MTRVADDATISKLARQQNDVFRRVREGSLLPERVFRMHRALLGTLLVPFNPARSWEDAVKAGRYDDVFIAHDFNPAIHLPPPLTGGSQGAEITLRTQDMTTTTAQWLNLLGDGKKSGQQFAHPLVVLAVGEHEPDEQLDAPIFTVWRAAGRLWSLILDDVAVGHDLSVDCGSPGDDWNARYRAAAVTM